MQRTAAGRQACLARGFVRDTIWDSMRGSAVGPVAAVADLISVISGMSYCGVEAMCCCAGAVISKPGGYRIEVGGIRLAAIGAAIWADNAG
jgi:hypothetical protein